MEVGYHRYRMVSIDILDLLIYIYFMCVNIFLVRVAWRASTQNQFIPGFACHSRELSTLTRTPRCIIGGSVDPLCATVPWPALDERDLIEIC